MTNQRCRIVVLGGYGHFGAHVCRALAREPDLDIVVSGRRPQRAAGLISSLQGASGTTLSAQRLDHRSASFSGELAGLHPTILIHAAGPFQRQDYRVAATCSDMGIHYVDLADGRDFVTGISALDARAAARGALIVSGASTLPALSDAVLDELASDMASLASIEISIAPGQRTPRGLATIAGALSYCGRPFKSLRNGNRVTLYGWQDLQRRSYPALGRRWLANCDVPDLDLLPQRFRELRSISCHAALELAPLAVGLWSLSWLARWRLIDDWIPYGQALSRCVGLLDRFGSDVGGMHVGVKGTDQQGRLRCKDWHLVARQGHGPQIPAIPAAVVATKLARGEIRRIGALPCTGLFSLSDFAKAVTTLDISWHTVSRDARPRSLTAPARHDPQGQAAVKVISS